MLVTSAAQNMPGVLVVSLVLLLSCGAGAQTSAVERDQVLLQVIKDALLQWSSNATTDAVSGVLQVLLSQMNLRMTEMGAEIDALQAATAQTTADLRAAELNIRDARTSAFVHWGSATCSNTSNLVYSGVVGGGHFTHTGAAANYLCLTLSPVISSRVVPASIEGLFGAEYETGGHKQNKEPLCAVCRPDFATTVMIPGTDTCSPGWHRQYSGFIMAGRPTQTSASEFICVDETMASSLQGPTNENGALLYFVRASCGSLPCGPYVNDTLVLCAVCSK